MSRETYSEVGFLSLWQERRAGQRLRIRGLPGYLATKDSQEEILCFPVDVSSCGLGIISSEWLAVGTEIVFFVGRKQIKMEIVWSLNEGVFPEFPLSDDMEACFFRSYRYGLKTIEEDCDLIKIFEKAGCLL